jgi:hypothetical protein
MADYKLQWDGCVIRASDGVTIPPDEQNRDFAEYLAWVEAGGKPDPADPLTPEMKALMGVPLTEKERAALREPTVCRAR